MTPNNVMTHELKTEPAVVQGVATRISAAEKAAMTAGMLLKMEAQPAILRATIQITRAATGKVEEYEIVGTADEHLKD
jgi:nitrous oxidase accessory protein NosD